MQRSHTFLSKASDKYAECKDCGKRTPHLCLKCQYCYSCHWKFERPSKYVKAALA